MKQEVQTDVIDRIKEVMGRFRKMTPMVFAKGAKIDPSNFNKMLKGEINITPKTLKKIATAYRTNYDWLLTGEGEARISEQALTDGTGGTVPATTQTPGIGKPYYDVDFIGGFDLVENDQTTVPENNIVIQGFERADLWCNVTGHSMEPKINHGDIIALRKCALEDIQYGEIYAVVLDTIRTIKIIRKSQNPDSLRFIPINISDYDEQEFSKSRIINIFKVVGVISKFF